MKHWTGSKLPNSGMFPEHYSIREALRDGPSSTLLLTYDAVSCRDVVIKYFKPSAKGAYLREIRAVFDLQHPNMLHCLDTFHSADGMACIVYEYLSGGSLSALLANQQPLASDTILACLRSLLEALVYLHGLNRIHCDIKPENILLRPTADGNVEFVLIDLGAACFLREALQGRHVTGTPSYIAPERIHNRFFFNSDLYSLGVIAYEMCTGKRPFNGTVEEITQANLTQIPSLTGIRPPALRDFIDHLLVKNPQKRIANAALALSMLNNASQPTKQQAFPSGANENNGGNSTFPVNGQPLTLHCFHVNGFPLVALAYPQHVEIINPSQPEHPHQVLVTAYPLQILGNHKFAYSTPSRIQIVDLRDGSEQLVKERLADLMTWHVAMPKLVWSDTFHHFYNDLRTGEVVSFTLADYLCNTKIAILSDGGVVTSEGPTNNKIVLRAKHAKLKREWQLTDMVVALGHNGTHLLAMTMSLGNPTQHSLWCLGITQLSQKLVLEGHISQALCANGTMFWLTDNAVLSCCGPTLRPETLHTFALGLFKLAVSYDHCFIAAGQKTGDHKLFITLLKNQTAT